MKKRFILLSILVSFLPAVARATVLEGWERHVIGVQESPIYLYVADMDGDGDLDIVSTNNVHPFLYVSEVAWYQNNLNTGGGWKKFIIAPATEDNATNTTNANGVVVADIDGDGNPDVVVGTGMVTKQAGTVYWFKAPKDPTQENWQRFQVEPATDMSFMKMYTMDVNNDGKPDIIAGTNQGTFVYINPGNPAQDGAQWERQLLAEGTGSSNYLADMDCNRKLDIVNSQLGASPDYQGNISWLEPVYKGGVVSFERTMIDDNLFKAFDVNVMDVNGDYRKDVVVSIFQKKELYWYEAPARTGDPWTKHTISDTFAGTDLYTGDINGDRKSELVASGLFMNKISFFIPSGSKDDIQWTEQVLDDNIALPGDISLNDLDGDGDLDVVLAGMGEDQIIWYENKTPQKYACVLRRVLGNKSPALSQFRGVRDNYLQPTVAGRSIIDSYYTGSARLIELLKMSKGVKNMLFK